MENNPNIIEVKGLKTHFHLHKHSVRAVDGMDFHLEFGETLGIVGESGCGKSITAMSIMGLIPSPPGRIESGEILFHGEDLLKADEKRMREIRGNRISMIFQEPMTSLNPVYTVGFQISEVLMLHRGMSKEESLAESIRLLRLVGISNSEHRVHEYPFQLSGGLRQRVMVAMAVACQPEILIADEPTTALDVTIQAQILHLMKNLKETLDTAIMFITHDLAVIAAFSDRVMVMYSGVCVESAPVKDLFRKPLHPYTEGLLNSVPVLGDNKHRGTGRKLHGIEGNLPNPFNYPKGCRFAPRCPKVMDRCHESEPVLLKKDENHEVRCFLYQ